MKNKEKEDRVKQIVELLFTMDSNSLHTFLKVYQEKSISKAASKLFISPQGCSKIIQKIERELGVSLFIRVPHGLEPTLYGERLYNQALLLLPPLQNLKSYVLHQETLDYTLSVESTLGIRSYLGPAFFHDFSKTYPHILLDLLESPDKAVVERLRSNELELAILGGSLDFQFDATPFTLNYPVVIVGNMHPLARKTYIAYEDLAPYPIALENRDFLSHSFIIDRFQSHNVTLSIAMETTEIHFLHQQALDNFCVCISFSTAALNGIPDHTVLIPFEDQSFIWKTYLVHRKNVCLTPRHNVSAGLPWSGTVKMPASWLHFLLHMKRTIGFIQLFR